MKWSITQKTTISSWIEKFNNVKIIKQFFIDHNISVLDLSYGVPGENFIDQNYVCEHLDYYGRKIIAKNIIEILLQN